MTAGEQKSGSSAKKADRHKPARFLAMASGGAWGLRLMPQLHNVAYAGDGLSLLLGGGGHKGAGGAE